MERNEIVEKLKDIFQMAMGNNVNLEKFDESANLVTDLGLNSVGILYLVIGVEEIFSITFDNVSFSDFETVSDVIDYIVKKTL